MIKKLRIKFVCINMTIITIMLFFIFFTIVSFTRHNLEHPVRQVLPETAPDPTQFMDHLIHNCILIGIISFFAFLGISIFLANWAVKPVDKAWKQQKQFIADASHKLKTPLTVILTNGEFLCSQNYNEMQKSHFSEHILIMARQMKGLVEGLLELSRIDNGFIKTMMKDLDFSTLTEHSISLFEPLYFENDLNLVTRIPPNLHIKGSESHLKQVVDILLDNALKYASPSSTVTVTLTQQKLFLLFSVSSQGNPIGEEELTHIFDRFYRAKGEKNASGSYGLGLSIAKSIISQHHGKIWAESRDGINTFYVRLHSGQTGGP